MFFDQYYGGQLPFIIIIIFGRYACARARVGNIILSYSENGCTNRAHAAVLRTPIPSGVGIFVFIHVRTVRLRFDWTVICKDSTRYLFARVVFVEYITSKRTDSCSEVQLLRR